jgi:hypothetical protein
MIRIFILSICLGRLAHDVDAAYPRQLASALSVLPFRNEKRKVSPPSLWRRDNRLRHLNLLWAFRARDSVFVTLLVWLCKTYSRYEEGEALPGFALGGV